MNFFFMIFFFRDKKIFFYENFRKILKNGSEKNPFFKKINPTLEFILYNKYCISKQKNKILL